MKLSKVKQRIKKAATAIGACLIVSNAVAAQDLMPVKMCALMITGEGGPEAQYVGEFVTAALSWGAKIEYKPYVNDQVIVEELKAGACDIATMTSISARKFNKFTGTIDAPAAIPDYEHLRMVLETLAKPSAAKYMVAGDFEVVGIQPAGAIYVFTNDRNIQTIADLAGKRMSVLDTLPQMSKLVVELGMTPVSSTLTNVYQKFNNGAIDITGGPALVYDLMELHKGLEPNGGILDEPVLQATMQIVARRDRIPEGFGQKSRQFLMDNFDLSLKLIRAAEQNIPEKLWIKMPEERRDEYNTRTRQVRLQFREEGFYDGKMLTLLRKIRCKQRPTLAECTAPDAE